MSNNAAADFCRGMNMLLSAGIPLVQALNVLAYLGPMKARKATEKIADQVKNGEPLWKAIESSQLFLPIIIRSLRIAEQAGQLEGCFNHCQDYYLSRESFKQSLVSALSYPAFVVVLSMLMLSFICVTVMPMFTSLFSGFDIKLPLLTTGVIYIFSLLSYCGVPVLFTLAVIALPVQYLMRNKFNRQYYAFMLTLPFIKEMLKQKVLADLGCLIESGVSLPEALTEIIKGENNTVIAGTLNLVKEGILEGESLSEALHKCKLFSGQIIGLVQLGEETASLGKMLLEISKMQKIQVENRIKSWMRFLEPAATLTVGAVVSVIAIAMFLPIFSLIDILQQ